MAFIFKYPDSNHPKLVIGVDKNAPITIPDNVLRGIVSGELKDVRGYIASFIPKDAKILFVLYNNSAQTYNGAIKEFCGKGGYKILYKNIVVYEKKPKIPSSIIVIFIIALVVAIILIFVKECTNGNDSNENWPQSIIYDNDELPGPSDSILSTYSGTSTISEDNDEDGWGWGITEDNSIQAEQSNINSSSPQEPNVSPQVQQSATMTDGQKSEKKKASEDQMCQATSASTSKTNNDYEFEKNKKDGLTAYQHYYQNRKNEKDRLLAIRYFEEALKYKNDEKITQLIQKLKNEK